MQFIGFGVLGLSLAIGGVGGLQLLLDTRGGRFHVLVRGMIRGVLAMFPVMFLLSQKVASKSIER